MISLDELGLQILNEKTMRNWKVFGRGSLSQLRAVIQAGLNGPGASIYNERATHGPEIIKLSVGDI